MPSSRTVRDARSIASTLLLLTGMSLAACHRGEHASTLPAAVRRDPVLASIPFGTDLAVHVDLAKLRRSPTYASLHADLGTLAEAMALAVCGEDPLAGIASFTVAHDFDSEPMLVLRGADAAPTVACADAWARALLGRVPARSARIGPIRIYASTARIETLRDVLRGDARSSADDPRYEPMRAMLRDAGFAVLVDLDSLPLAEAEIPPILGLPREPTLAMLDAATVQVVDVDAPETGGLRIASVTGFAESEAPSRALAVVTEAWSRNVAFARAAMLSVPSALELTDVDPASLASLEGVVQDVRISADESTLVVETELDDQALTSAADILRRAFVRYVHVARSTEARSNVVRLAEAMRGLVEQRAHASVQVEALPSAPMTPSTVPRGVAVLDPPGTWDSELYRMLQFSITEPHRYSYAISTEPDGFRVVARGDLDGDGQTSEFAMRGTMRPDGTVELGEIEVDAELE